MSLFYYIYNTTTEQSQKIKMSTTDQQAIREDVAGTLEGEKSGEEKIFDNVSKNEEDGFMSDGELSNVESEEEDGKRVPVPIEKVPESILAKKVPESIMEEKVQESNLKKNDAKSPIPTTSTPKNVDHVPNIAADLSSFDSHIKEVKELTAKNMTDLSSFASHLEEVKELTAKHTLNAVLLLVSKEHAIDLIKNFCKPAEIGDQASNATTKRHDISEKSVVNNNIQNGSKRESQNNQRQGRNNYRVSQNRRGRREAQETTKPYDNPRDERYRTNAEPHHTNDRYNRRSDRSPQRDYNSHGRNNRSNVRYFQNGRNESDDRQRLPRQADGILGSRQNDNCNRSEESGNIPFNN